MIMVMVLEVYTRFYTLFMCIRIYIYIYMNKVLNQVYTSNSIIHTYTYSKVVFNEIQRELQITKIF